MAQDLVMHYGPSAEFRSVLGAVAHDLFIRYGP